MIKAAVKKWYDFLNERSNQIELIIPQVHSRDFFLSNCLVNLAGCLPFHWCNHLWWSKWSTHCTIICSVVKYPCISNWRLEFDSPMTIEDYFFVLLGSWPKYPRKFEEENPGLINLFIQHFAWNWEENCPRNQPHPKALHSIEWASHLTKCSM